MIDKELAKQRRKKYLPFIKQQLRPLRPQAVFWFCFLIVGRGLSILVPLVLQTAINEVAVDNGQNTNIGVSVTVVLLLSLGLNIIIAYATYLNRSMLIKGADLARYGVYKKVFLSENNVFKQHTAGELMERVGAAADRLGRTYATIVPVFVVTVLYAISTFVIIAINSWIIALIVSAIYPVFLFFVYKVNKKAARHLTNISKLAAARDDVFLQGIKGADDWKGYNKQDEFLTQFRSKVQQTTQNNLKRQRFESTRDGMTYFVETALPMIMAVLTALFVSLGMYQVGMITLMLMLVSQLVQPTLSLMSIVFGWYETIIMGDRCYHVLDQCQDEQGLDVGEFERLEVDIKEYSFEQQVGNSDAAIDESKILLRDVAFVVNKGERVLIMATSGKGKSTLLNLITKRLHLKDEQGYIRINGIQLDQVGSRSLFDNVCYQAQEHFVFKATLRENVFMYDKFSEEEFDSVIKICCLQDFVAEYGKDRIIEHDNKNVSGGQLQRICIARALIRKSKVLLLDEPTSALDVGTIDQFMSNLKEYMDTNNTTLICVTHNTEMNKIADRVIAI